MALDGCGVGALLVDALPVGAALVDCGCVDDGAAVVRSVTVAGLVVVLRGTAMFVLVGTGRATVGGAEATGGAGGTGAAVVAGAVVAAVGPVLVDC